LEVLEDRCGLRSTVLTSQFPVQTWHDLVGSPTLADAILERILSNHHAIALKGETLRPVRKTNGEAKVQRRPEEA
jgi:DNA replication protein DnaC